MRARSSSWFRVWICTLAILPGVPLLTFAQAQTTVPAALLSGPIDAGSIIQLVDFAADAGAERRLRDALSDQDPVVRAAAARVVHVTATSAAVPELAAAMAQESSPDAVLEQARALLALGGNAYDEPVIRTWSRLGPSAFPVAVAYAAARGAAGALPALPRLRAVAGSLDALVVFFQAARVSAMDLGRVLDVAAADDDAELARGALAAAVDLRLRMDGRALHVLLGADGSPLLPLAAAEYVLRTWDGTPSALPADWRDVLETFARADASVDASNARVAVARELARRAAGMPASDTAGWRAVLQQPEGWNAAISWASTERLLTPAEWKQIRRSRPWGPATPPIEVDGPVVQAMDAYPSGYVAATMSATRCDARRARSRGFGGGAGLLTLDVGGRPSRVRVLDTGPMSAECDEALRLLLTTHVASGYVSPGEQRGVLVPFDLDYATCLESQAFAPRTIVPPGAVVQPPRKTRHRDPAYPSSALRGPEGRVVVDALIGTSGCVEDVKVRDSVDPRLDLAALRALVDWRFEPARTNGTAIPVRTTLVVTFNAR